MLPDALRPLREISSEAGCHVRFCWSCKLRRAAPRRAGPSAGRQLGMGKGRLPRGHTRGCLPSGSASSFHRAAILSCDGGTQCALRPLQLEAGSWRGTRAQRAYGHHSFDGALVPMSLSRGEAIAVFSPGFASCRQQGRIRRRPPIRLRSRRHGREPAKTQIMRRTPSSRIANRAAVRAGINAQDRHRKCPQQG